MQRNNIKPVLPQDQHKWRRNARRSSEVQEPSFLQNFLRCFSDYSERTTIHGFKYLSERGRPIGEKIYWLVAMVVSLSICITLILNIYWKWIYSPVVINFASDETHISEIPFPAVTICPEVKADVYKFNYTDILIKRTKGNLTEEEKRRLDVLFLVCIPFRPSDHTDLAPEQVINYIFEPVTFPSKTQEDFKPNKSKVLSRDEVLRCIRTSPDEKYLFAKLGLHIDDYVSDIKWKGKSFTGKLQELFFPILTEDGLCYTFNMLDRMELFTRTVKHQHNLFSTNGKQSNWFPEGGFAHDIAEDHYPRRTLSAGVEGGLVITFRMAEEQCDYMCGRSFQGFKVSLHGPTELPRIQENFYRVDFGRSFVATVKPKIMTTSAGLLNYNIADRNCLFKAERFLKFFKTYNQQNCLAECVTNFTFELCGCVGFYMPREESTPICSIERRKCLLIALEKLSAKISVTVDLKPQQIDHPVECDCLPACNSLTFDVETSETHMNFRERLLTLLEGGEIDKKTFELSKTKRYEESELNLFFKDVEFVTLERRELYGYTDFWGGIGGTLGLFVGFSLISIFEILYYLTLRVICNAKMFGRRYWAGAPQLIQKHEIIPTISSGTAHQSNVPITYLP